MDKSLDDVVRERQQSQRRSDRNRRGPRGSNSRGVRKPESSRNGVRDREESGGAWVHDRYDEDYDMGVSSRGRERNSNGYTDRRRDGRDEGARLPPGATRLRVENLHYELGEEDLNSLFNRIGPTISVQLKYDRAGRSEGIAYVTYERERDAYRAIDEFNGANAHGQPIHLQIVSSASSSANPNAGRTLFERVERPRSLSLNRDRDRERVRPSGRGSKIDRYVPGDRDRDDRDRFREREARDRPIVDRAEGGRGRRDGGGGGGDRKRGDRGRRGGGGSGGERGAGGVRRPKKTIEELDEEMSNYWNEGAGEAQEQEQEQEQGQGQKNGEVAVEQVDAGPAAVIDEDMMIE